MRVCSRVRQKERERPRETERDGESKTQNAQRGMVSMLDDA